MPSRTKTGLNLADKNSYVRVEENINDNLLKIDDDVDAAWGGLYGGYIQDETITKEVGKRYIDKFNKKAYICRKPSNVNTEDAYTECNVVNNLNKLQNLSKISSVINKSPDLITLNSSVCKTDKIVSVTFEFSFINDYDIGKIPGEELIWLLTMPQGFIPGKNVRLFIIPFLPRTNASSINYILEGVITLDGKIQLAGYNGEKPSILYAGISFKCNATYCI